ncbi:MAG: tRNA dihydrouridine synthase DusB [Marinifilaceae bacterium]|jgi:nifR3 family TIM-barrel protein|nr:tRNA dihydrouridine synthase DusB [Marinilabiliaceae bacterium JC040]MCT4600479.1 tRNA dihydrouridine synthase DusB [Marinifilaceae bacterium]
MKIGNVEFGDRPIVLAPMEDVTNPPFRKCCKSYGVDWMYTEFVSSDALVRNVEKTKKKLQIEEGERPVSIQIYGKDPEALAGAAKIAEEARPDFIDINFGCPVRKIAGKGAGAGLLQNVPLMEEIVRKVVDAVDIPVTTKTRLGWDEDTKHIVEVAERLQDAGSQALAIHGRTRAQMYKGEADWTLIGEVKNNQRMHIPIIGNGDITSPEIAEEYFNKYGVDAVMIGRACIGRPWVFKEIRHYLDTGEKWEAPLLGEQIDILRSQIVEASDWLDERRGILHMRRHMAQMFKGLYNFKDLRIQMLRANTLEDLDIVFNEIRNRYC